MMLIRRERRRLVTVINTKIQEEEAKIICLREEIKSMTAELQSKDDECKSRLLEVGQKSKKELETLEKSLTLKHRIQMDEVRKRYETTVRQIGTKLQEIEKEKGMKDSSQALVLASQMAQKTAKKLEEKVSEKITHLKNSLLVATEKARDTQEQLDKSIINVDILNGKIAELEKKVCILGKIIFKEKGIILNVH